jgi:lysyl-tRNA synthetase class 2
MALESTGTHKDPITGEMISKQYISSNSMSRLLSYQSILRRELKRREKQREKEARIAAATANRPPASTGGATDDVVNEDNLSPNVSYSCRYMHTGRTS